MNTLKFGPTNMNGLKKRISGAASVWSRTRPVVRVVVGLSILTLVLFFSSIIAPAPVGYAAAFPGQNGKFVVSIDTTGSWDYDKFEIFTINANGKNLKQLTHNSDFDMYPAWSPDGKKIAFTRRDANDNYDIYVMKANGKKETNLTNTPDVDEIIPSWSPDGKKLAVAYYPDGDFDFDAQVWDGMEIFVMDADGGNRVRLTNNKFEDYGPSWSPDGEKIAYATLPDEHYEIYVMDVDGSNKTNLTRNPDYHDGFWAPYWSPDGEKIAFPSKRDGNWEIYVMDADTGDNQTNLTNNDASDGVPVWSPDGQKIAFRRGFEIYVMDASDGNNQMRLTDTEEKVRGFDWQSLGGFKKNR